MALEGLGHGASAQHSPSLVYARVAAPAPTSSASELFVIIPSYGIDKWGPLPWSPNGVGLPAVGAECLVGFDDRGMPWLARWATGWVAPAAESEVATIEGELDAAETAIANLEAKFAKPSWIAPTLENGWANVGTAPTNEPAGYLKDSLGFVHLRGRMKAGTLNAAAFTLPAGYRPGCSNGLYVCAAWTGANPTSAFVDTSTTGSMALFAPAGTTEVGLGGVSFLAEL